MIDDRKPRERQEPKIAMPDQSEGGNGRAAAARAGAAKEPPRELHPDAPPPRAPRPGTDASDAGSGAVQPEAPQPEAPQPEAPREVRPDAAAEAGSEPADLEARVAALEAEKAELKEQLLRALADAENTRRRIQRELDDKLKYAPAALAKDLLSVADNLGRALGAVPAEVREQEAVKSLIAGVEMTEKALMEAFAKHGIQRIDPLGQKLDPHRHEAMMEVQDPTKRSGTVAQVFEAGYELKGRLLRPARVAVAKGGPAGGEAPEPGSTVDTKA